MTEKQKRLAIIGGTVLAAVLLLLMLSRKGAGAAVGTSGDMMLPTAFGPQLGPIYTGGGSTFVIPGLDLSGPNLNMIGACCSDCNQSRPAFNNPTRAVNPVYNTYNMGNTGPNIANYSTVGSGSDGYWHVNDAGVAQFFGPSSQTTRNG